MEALSAIFSFQKLLVWQKSRELVKCVYSALSAFPQTEKFALADQLRRAVISVPSNIAEGSAKESEKDQIRFIEIAYGSLMETFCQLQLAQDLNYTPAQNLTKSQSGFRKSRECSAFSAETNNQKSILHRLFLKAYASFKL